MVGLRLTPDEMARVEAHQHDDELLSECLRRLLVAGMSIMIPTRPPKRLE